MVLKRKRSEEAFTSPMSSTSSLSSRASQSPSPQYGHAKPTDNLMDFEFTFSSIPSPWSRPVQPFGRLENQSGRTCKRFRDDRPDERAIHRNTLQKLFAAQREHPNASPIPSHPVSQPSVVVPKPQKSTLHSFWSIRQQPAIQPVQMSVDVNMDQPQDTPKCEDCDQPLDASELELGMMEVDNDTSDAWACSRCSRRVCGVCAVSWDERTCLSCAFNR